MKYLILALLFSSCVRVRTIETPLSAVEHIIIEGLCTGFAVFRPGTGLIYEVDDITCRDLNVSTREYLSSNLPGRMLIKEGRQYIIVDPLVFEAFLDRLVDEGFIQVVREEQ